MNGTEGSFVWVGKDGSSFYNQSTDSNREKYNKQRAKTGVGDDETFSLDKTVAVFILPRLKRYRELMNGFPAELTMEKWTEIVDELIWFFEQVDDGLCSKGLENSVEYYKRIEEAQKLFGKYFVSLWW